MQYARRIVGRKEYRGGTQTLPLKLNYAGVMPIIFGQALLLFPSTIVNMVFKNSPTAQRLAPDLTSGWMHYILYAVMIFFFSYFWVAMMFQPNQIADELKKNGGYIPGVRPGKPTAEFLDYTMSRLTFAGAVFLIVVAILPQCSRACSTCRTSRHSSSAARACSSSWASSSTRCARSRRTCSSSITTASCARAVSRPVRYSSGRTINEGEPARQSTLVMLCVGAALLLICGLAIALNK